MILDNPILMFWSSLFMCGSSKELDAAMDRLALKRALGETVKPPARETVKKTGDRTIDGLWLESIDMGEGMGLLAGVPVAVINGQTVKKKDTIMGARIISIKKDHVKIKYNGYYYRLDLQGNKELLRK